MGVDTRYDRLKQDTRSLVGITVVLIVIGLIFIYSSSSVYALEQFGSAHYFLKRQAYYVIPACGAFVFFALFPLRVLRTVVPFFFIGSFILTILTLIPGIGAKINGSNRWLFISGISIQPSELLKLFLIMYVGLLLEKKQTTTERMIKNYSKILALLCSVFVILLKQPDFGSVVTILITIVSMLFVAECKLLHLGLTLLAACPFLVALIFLKAYRLNRILIFLNPWVDPQGRGFQIIQSLIAIGSGSTWGLGIAYSKQKFFYLPMQHTDFIFPIIAEETGFIGSCAVVLLFLLFCLRGLRIAIALESPFSIFTTLGFIVLISLQAFINLMVTTGMLPTKGLGLPLISYGGTSLICFCAMVGVIVNMVRSDCR